MPVSEFMRRALGLAASARHRTAPNPMVGAVLVQGGTVVGEGFHALAGRPHAEAAALAEAGPRARGATAYVTLEPCVHQGRTGPCAEALIASGVERVVVAMADPDDRVNGQGIAALRDAGVAVEVGDGEAQAEELNAGYIRARREGRPFTALKFAMSLDGRIATSGGESQWITGPAARREAHRLREAYDAVVVGAGTVLADDPELTARDDRGEHRSRQPLRVVVDGLLRIDPGARFLDPELPGKALVITTVEAASDEARFSAAEVATLPGVDGVIDMADALALLRAKGVRSVLVEGGGELAWSFVAGAPIDHVYAFIAPAILGGHTAKGPVGGTGFAHLPDATRLRIVNQSLVDTDVLIEAVSA